LKVDLEISETGLSIKVKDVDLKEIDKAVEMLITSYEKFNGKSKPSQSLFIDAI
jgi:hypothetical protein